MQLILPKITTISVRGISWGAEGQSTFQSRHVWSLIEISSSLEIHVEGLGFVHPEQYLSGRDMNIFSATTLYSFLLNLKNLSLIKMN